MSLQEIPTDPSKIRASSLALFLDVDGTLLDIAPTPDAVIVDTALKDLLAHLGHATGGALALVSGRAIADLDHLFRPLRFKAAGQHGAERRFVPDGPIIGAPPLPAGLRAAAIAVAGGRLLVEDKGAAVALHVRAAPGEAPMVEAALRAALATYPDHELLCGKAVFEIRRRGAHKGEAVAEFLALAPFAGRLPVYLGDDRTDDDAIALVRARGGIGLKVAPGEPLTCPKDVRRWLEALG